MQEKTFTKYFKKTLKSASPASRPNQFETYNIFPPFLSPKSPMSKKLTSKVTSPQTFTEIESQIPPNKDLKQELPEYTTKVVGMISPIETIKITKKVNRVLVEKDDANLIQKYRKIREKCLKNEIKLSSLLNELKEEMHKGISEKSLDLAFEILSSFDMTYTCNDNCLQYVKDVLMKFCYLQKKDVMNSLMNALSFEYSEVKNMPLLFLVEKICSSLKIFEKSHLETVDVLKSQVQTLNEQNQELKETNFKFFEKMEKIESESRALVDKELLFFREKVNLVYIYI